MDPRQRILMALMAAGAPGTQGGPVQESQLMRSERVGQGLGGAALGVLGLGLGDAVAPPFGGAIGALPGLDNLYNASTPNIRDVYADQRRLLKQQGR